MYSDQANQWSVTGLDETATYVFRVRAKNNFGWSNFSASSFAIELDRVLAQKGALKANFGKANSTKNGQILTISAINCLLRATI